MATLKDHQAAMVELLAHGTAIPASATRLAHALHDVLAALNDKPVATEAHTERRSDATTSGLNDAALAYDLAAVKPKQTSLESLLKQRDNTIRQLKARVADLKADYANLDAQLNAVLAIQKEPEQAGCRKEDTQVADGWIEWHGGECPVPPDTIVTLKLFDDSVWHEYRAEEWNWRDTTHLDHIVAYKVVEKAE